MSITIDISPEKLREAEELLEINDPTQLFLSLLDEELARRAATRALQPGRDAALAGQAAPPSMTQEEAFRYLASVGGSMPGLELPRRRRVEDY